MDSIPYIKYEYSYFPLSFFLRILNKQKNALFLFLFLTESLLMSCLASFEISQTSFQTAEKCA